MDYEKKYKEALERARIWKEKSGMPKNRQGILDDIFPELKESKNEKIRKWLIRTLKSLNNSPAQIDGAYEMMLPAIDWLEKQDKKDEEILVLKDQIESLHAAIKALKEVHKIELEKQDEQKPTWSEEDEKKRNLLIAILNVNHPNGCFKVNPIDTTDMEAMSKDELVSWLKSLKPQNRWKPSEEQMKVLNECLNFAANHESPHWNIYIFGTLNNLIRQLKNLREE